MPRAACVGNFTDGGTTLERSPEPGGEIMPEVTRTAGVIGGETSGREVRGDRNGWILVWAGSTYVGTVAGTGVATGAHPDEQAGAHAGAHVGAHAGAHVGAHAGAHAGT